MKFTLYVATTQGLPSQKMYPRIVEVNDIDSLIEATKFDHTVCQYKDDGRKTDNFIQADAIWFDIDNAFSDNPDDWVTVQTIQDELDGFAVAVGPSRNHMKQKFDPKTNRPTKGPRPRLHGYLPIPLVQSHEKFRGLLLKLHKKYPQLHMDPAIKDAGRHFFAGGTTAEDYWMFEGDPISKVLTGKTPGSPSTSKSGKREVTVSELTSREIEANPEWIQEGERHAALLKVAKRYARQRKPVDEIFNATWSVNVRLQAPKEEDEIRKICKWSYDNLGGLEAFDLIKNYSWKLGADGKFKIDPIFSTTPEMWDAMEHFITLEDIAGKRQLSLRKDPSLPVGGASALAAVLEKCGFLWDIKSAGGLTKEEIYHRFVQNVVAYKRVTCVPEQDMDEETFMLAVQPFPAAELNGSFRKYMDLFTFESVEDRYRFAAGILSMFLPGKWDSQIPLFAIRAPAQNAGKSTVVRRSVEMITGIPAIEQTGEDMQNDTAQFTGLLAQASRVILYDNLEKLKDAEERAIARAVTDKLRAAWFFGQSRSRIRNSFVYFATFNDSETFGKDLQARALVVKMMDPEKVSGSQRNELDNEITQWGEEMRDEVISDIRALMALPQPEMEIGEDMRVKLPDDLKPIQKFSSWSLRILSALRTMFPEVEVFDFSPKEGYRIDEGTEAISEFLFDSIINYGIWDERTKRKVFIKSSTEMRKIYNMEHKEAGDLVRSPKLFGVLLRDAAKEISFGTLERVRSNGISLWNYSVSIAEYSEIKKARSGNTLAESQEKIPAFVKEALIHESGLTVVEGP